MTLYIWSFEITRCHLDLGRTVSMCIVIRYLRRMCRCFLDCLGVIRDFCRYLFRCFSGEDNEENDRLLTKSIYVTTSERQKHCRGAFHSFQHKYLRSCNLKWTDIQIIENTVIVICPKISRLQEDITETLNYFEIREEANLMLVVMHYCERGIKPENLLTENTDSRVTTFTNIVYSDSEHCYDCDVNDRAAKAIKNFIRNS